MRLNRKLCGVIYFYSVEEGENCCFCVFYIRRGYAQFELVIVQNFAN